jgi:gliding motility-associated-like protein
VSVSVGSLSIPSGDVNQLFCLYDSPIVSNLTATGSTIVWYDAASNGNAYVGTEDLVDGQTYYAENTNGSCSSISRLAVLVNISDMSFMLTSEVIPTCGKSDGEIQIDVTGGIGNYIYTWSNGSSTNTLLDLEDGVYTLNITDDVNCSLDTLVRLNCESTTIPEIITPNGNGKNDTWVLELDPEAEVKVFNRWGNMIYSASPYLDDWDGKANEGMSLGKDYLPSGTYFYIIDKKDGKDPVSGYIELVR